jgi:hypothetical protein
MGPYIFREWLELIRPATHSDIPALVDMVMGFFANGELDGTGLTPDRDTIEFFIQDNIDMIGRAVFVAEIDGEVIGAIAGGLAPWMWNANILTLIETGWFIPKIHRDKYKMAAMSLRKQFHKWGRQAGATVLIMSSTSREESPRVRKFYEDSGLRILDFNYVGPL